MGDLLNKLYNFEYFDTILIIAIIVLIILFFIVLLVGKKDQKKRELEATKKLEQINSNDAFKIENTTHSVEINNQVNALQDNTIVIPTVDEIPTSVLEEPTNIYVQEQPMNVDLQISRENLQNELNDSLVYPELNFDDLSKVEINDNSVLENNTIDFNTVTPEVNNTVEYQKPELDFDDTIINMPVVEEPVIEINDLISAAPNDNFTIPVLDFNNESEPILDEIKEAPLMVDNSVESDDIFKSFAEEPQEDIKVPEFNLDEFLNTVKSVENTKEIVKEETYVSKPKSPEVFSSVYIPKPEENKIEIKIQPKGDVEEDLGIELPALKKDKVETKEEVKDIPVLHTYDLDSIAGETYRIDIK